MVTLSVGAVMAFLLWGVSCAMYDAANSTPAVFTLDDGSEPTTTSASTMRIRGRGAGLAFAVAGVVTFVSKSFTMLPQLPSVLGFIVKERFWFVLVSAGILGGVALFGVFLKRTEAALANPPRKKRRRK